MTFAATILTLYPEMFPGPLGVSLAGKALERGDWSCDTVNPRDFATDRHRTVDDTPAGGGAGMVLKADVMAAALDSLLANSGMGGLSSSSEAIGQTKYRHSSASGNPVRKNITQRHEAFKCSKCWKAM